MSRDSRMRLRSCFLEAEVLVRARRHSIWLCLTLCLWLAGPLHARAEETAKFKISGFGILGNRELKRSVALLLPENHRSMEFDANFVEDAALILLSKVKSEGYLRPSLTVYLTLTNGVREKVAWADNFETVLPRPLAVRRVHFKLKPGLLYHYKELSLHGTSAIKPNQARAYFIQSDTLIPTKRTRLYTPARLERSMANLVEALSRRGYQEASVVSTNLLVDDRSGQVQVEILVDEGLLTLVRSVTTEIIVPDESKPRQTNTVRLGVPYSRYWLQDYEQQLRTNQYARGYPDVSTDAKILRREVGSTNIQVDLLATVETGPEIKLREVKFEGNERTRRSILKRRVDLKPAEPLNRMAAERGRFRLAKLGIFDSVGVRYDDAEPGSRDVTYELDEGKVIDFSLLFGYGSYEMLRGGFELSQYNIFGRAHQSRLRAIQSFRSSHLEYLYTLPELFREDLNIFATASGLRREEVSFVREEYGAGVGAQRYVETLQSEVSLRYNYEFVNAADADVALSSEVERALVSSVILDLKHDRRDNPLLPRAGYKAFNTVEFASATLGGEVDYQRVEIASSVHQRVGRGRYIHLGLAHGFISTLGGSRADLPFNKRFFPGGENSIRGYQQGEASPLDSDGDVIGAETYLQGNVEFEQILTPAWSVVFFVDGVGFAEDISDYPVDDALYSAGGGLRWKTLIGPARLEYGYNLNPRDKDPVGTLHFSLGFPF